MSAPRRSSIGDHLEPVTTWDAKAAPPTDSWRYIDISSVSRETKLIESTTEITRDTAPSRARQVVRADDVLVSTVRPNLNAVARVPAELDGAIASTAFAVLRPRSDSVDPGYLFHVVRQPHFVASLVHRATGASYPAVTDRAVREYRAVIPGVGEQRRIAAILDKADALRRKRDESLRLVDDFLRATFLDMFGDPVRNPKGWPVVRIRDIGRVRGGLQVTKKRRTNEIEVPYLRVANVFRNALDLHEIKSMRVTAREAERTRLSRGDILVVEGHGNPAEIGRAAVWDGSIDPCVHQNHLIRVQLDRAAVLPDYVSTYLNTAGGRRHLLRAGRTTSGLNTISTSDVKQATVLRPSLELQRRYAALVDRARTVAGHLTDAVARMSDLAGALGARLLATDPAGRRDGR